MPVTFEHASAYIRQLCLPYNGLGTRFFLESRPAAKDATSNYEQSTENQPNLPEALNQPWRSASGDGASRGPIPHCYRYKSEAQSAVAHVNLVLLNKLGRHTDAIAHTGSAAASTATRWLMADWADRLVMRDR